MPNRTWRVAGNFARIGEVAVTVISPNWQGAARKGVLAIKKVPLLKGRKITHCIFTVDERDPVKVEAPAEQGSLLVTDSPAIRAMDATEPVKPEPQEG